MVEFECLGPWSDSRVPQIALDYPLIRMSDTTGQPSENISPDPNILQTWGQCHDADWPHIEGDAVYFVLWSVQETDVRVMAQRAEPRPGPAQAEYGKDNPASAKRFGQLVAWLAKQGASQDAIRAAVGAHVASRTHGQVADAVRAWVRPPPRRKGE